jgi:putative nucleotidyltransferase with HDIG domain
MFVSRLDRPWLGTPFLIQGLLVRTDEDVEEFRRWCTYLYIDTERGDDAVEAMSPERWEFILQSALPPVAAEMPSARDYQVDFSKEIGVARDLLGTANTLLRAILNDARLDRSLRSADAKRVVAGMAESIMRNPDAMLLLTALKDKDQYTQTHSINVCILALVFGRELGLSLEDLNTLGLGALLHDIGKMRIPLAILNKPGQLTKTEFEVMKRHVQEGVALLEHMPMPKQAIEAVQGHHERYDGSGYPQGLRGANIGLYGRIAAIVDVYDALTTDRIYRPGIISHDAFKYLYEGGNKAFEQALVLRFIQALGTYPVGSLVKLNSGEIGLVVSTHRAHRLRPRVRLILNPHGQPYLAPVIVDLVNQFTVPAEVPLEIMGIVSPAKYGIDLKNYVRQETGV